MLFPQSDFQVSMQAVKQLEVNNQALKAMESVPENFNQNDRQFMLKLRQALSKVDAAGFRYNYPRTASLILEHAKGWNPVKAAANFINSQFDLLLPFEASTNLAKYIIGKKMLETNFGSGDPKGTTLA